MAAKQNNRMAPDDPDRKHRYPATRKSMDPLVEFPVTAKVCARCEELKPLAAFGTKITKPYSPVQFIKSYCTPCVTAVSREWHVANHARKVAKVDAWKANNPEKVTVTRQKRMLRNYGLTLEMYELLLLDQGGVCGICATSTPGGYGNRFHVDHDHATGKIRGLLCTRCNVGLGNFRHTQKFLLRAARYLKQPPAPRHLYSAPDVGQARPQIDFLDELENR